MRKYVKPVLFYEHYELSQHIADCSWELKDPKTGNQSIGMDGSCVAYPDEDDFPGDLPLFLSTTAGCEYNETNYDAYCYENGGTSGMLFTS